MSALQWMAAGSAAACWCRPSPSASPLWPPPDSSDISPDTAIVVWSHLGANTRRIDAALVGPDGEDVPLEETRHFDSWWQCSGETSFFQPKQRLEPGSSYTLTLFTKGSSSTLRTTTFSVAAESTKPRAKI